MGEGQREKMGLIYFFKGFLDLKLYGKVFKGFQVLREVQKLISRLKENLQLI